MPENYICSILLLFTILLSNILCEKLDILREKSFPACKACKVYTNSFQKGLEKTATGKFEGGDAAWEEEKLGSYAQSELRLIEIQERICSDVEEGKNQCYTLNGEYDHLLEEWWFNYQLNEPDVFNHLCVNNLKVCCMDNHYGPDCLPCSGYPDNVCNNNGRCKGAGTRKGNGECICNTGYAGTACAMCNSTFHESYKDGGKLLCSKCHESCVDNCTKAGPIGCLNCTFGWSMDNENGCVDINECFAAKPVCSSLEFCVNTEGSYTCLNCDRSCYGCTGDGPDMCITCASGYVLVDNICTDTSAEGRKQYVHLMRYLTYLGLTIATCIIFQRNIAIAAIVGTCVAMYIGISEYMLRTSPSLAESILQHIPKDL